jgi:hypothetical protein
MGMYEKLKGGFVENVGDTPYLIISNKIST